MTHSASRRLALAACAGLALIVGLACAGRADDVPFAQPPLSGARASMSLADLMTLVQARHIKLYEAIKARNWPLVAFEARIVTDNLAAAALLYHNIPIELVEGAVNPLVDLQDAEKLKDAGKAHKAFDTLTAACNACHQAGGVGFIAIETPTASPFSNQRFAPQGK